MSVFETFKVDLDTKEFVEKAEGAQRAIEKIGGVESVGGLLSTLKEFAPVLTAAAAVVYTFKKAFDFTLEGEQIKGIVAQFDALSKSAGLASDELKEKIMAATGGLIDETDALEAASAGIVSLGENADRLPEIFTLARNAVKVFGGEVTTRVQELSSALAAGNTRSLRQIGIIIDADKALKQYAASLGITKDMLTDAQKKQAIMNAALEQGKEKFDNMPKGVKPVTEALTQLKVAIKDMGETFALIIEKTLGPSFAKMTQWLRDVAVSANLTFKAYFGGEAEKAAKKVHDLSNSIKTFDADIAALEKREGLINKIMPDSVIQSTIARLKGLKEAAVAELAEIQKKTEKPAEAKKAEEVAGEPKMVGLTREQATELAEHRMGLIVKMRELELESAKGTEREEMERESYIVSLKEESAAKIAALRAKGPGQVKNLAEQELLIHKETASKIAKINADGEKVKQTENKKTNAMMMLGQEALGRGMIGAFKNITGGAKEMAKAMKAAFLGVIADKAEAEGSALILEGAGMWPIGGYKIAAGGALVALSSLIRAAAGGGGGGIGASSSAGGGGGGGETRPPVTETQTRPDIQAAQQAKGKSVTIAIAGNYFETEQTRRALLGMVRQETDATAFTYQQIPQGLA